MGRRVFRLKMCGSSVLAGSRPERFGPFVAKIGDPDAVSPSNSPGFTINLLVPRPPEVQLPDTAAKRPAPPDASPILDLQPGATAAIPIVAVSRG